MGSIAFNVFTDKGHFDGCGIAEFKREALYQSNLKLVSLPSNSASEPEKGCRDEEKTSPDSN